MPNDEKLLKLSEGLEKLYPAPKILFSLVEAVNNPESNVALVEDLINKDPAFAAKILSMANSAYYGFDEKVANVHQAIILLGFNTILNLTINICVHDLFHFNFSSRGFTADTLWKHSVGVSLCAKVLSKMYDPSNYENYITLGILHDLGLVVEAQFFRDDLLSILGCLSPDPLAKSFMQLETELIGHAHPYLTSFFCSKWKLPKAISGPALYHHDFTQAPEDIRMSACLLNLADMIVMESHYGFFFPYAEKNTKDVYEYLNLDDSGYKDIRKEFDSLAKDIEPLFS